VQLRIDSQGVLESLVNRSDSWTSGGESGSGSEQIWSRAEFSGSGVDLAFSQLAMKMNRSHVFQEETHTETDSGGAVEWQDTAYAPTESGAFFDAFNAKDMSAEPFFAEAPSEQSFESSDYDCSAAADIEIEIDMSSEGMAAVDEKCGGNSSGDLNFHDMCYGGDTQKAFESLWQN
jgi:hypothetical protein